LAFNDVKQNLYYVDLSTSKVTLVDTDPLFLHYPYPVWSPDSNWIAYQKSAQSGLSALHLYSLEKKKKWQITDGMSYVSDPVFGKKGKYLFFAVSTDVAVDTAWLDMSEYPHNPTNSLYAMVLSKLEPSPFKPESDEEGEEEKKKEKEPDKDKKKNKGKKEEEKKVKAIRIDIPGIERRIVAIDIPTRRYVNLQAGQEGTLYYLHYNYEKRNFDLYMYDLKKRKEELLLKGINNYTLSHDGKKMLYRQKRYQWYIVDAGKKPKPGDGMLKTSSIETYSVPAKEYQQILQEAWRINRDLFYDPGMHGQDWGKIKQQYEVYLPHIAHRSDLTYIIAQMIGEYSCGHAYTGGGMYPNVDRVPGGLLGADYEISDGYYKFKKIYLGENWNPKLRSPLTEPGINVKEGEYILEVNGRKLTGKSNIYSFFQKTARKQITIKVNSKPDLVGARLYTVVPIANEFSLRHRQWIEDNRKKVEKWSEGKVGYVYLPNTSVSGFNYFHRYFFAHLDKEAIVFDERFNGGGYAADYIINMLKRPLLNWWQPRYGKPFATPNNAHFGPKVMIINEHAGSGGDYMPWAFRETGLGKLVGKRTWGGLVGISGYPPLMDGGYITAPSFGIVSKDGEFFIENEGVAPDIEVDITPLDFIKGKDTQLFKAVEVVLEELKKKPLPKYKRKGFPRGR
jgi:tricorn protease